MKRSRRRALRETAIAVAVLPLGLLLGYLLSNWGDSRIKKRTVIVVEAPDPTLAGERAAPVSTEPPIGDPENPLPATPDLDAKGDNLVVVIENPPAEMTGGIGNPENRTPDLEQAPEKAVESCDEFLLRQFSESTALVSNGAPAKAGFSVEFEGLVNPWSLMTVSLMPEDLLLVNVLEDPALPRFRFESEDGEFSEVSETTASWKAPAEPGIYCVRVLAEDSDKVMCLHAAVMRPWEGDTEYLGTYRIGVYQDKPYLDNPRYKKPRGFIEVTEENQDTWITPHLQLSQFVCKQKSSFPKYMLADTRLLLKLETLIEELEESGREASHLYISSGFRTPAYNIAIGNKTSYSRHLYGDAADLFVDSNRDGKLDDLDLNGSTGDGDAAVIQAAADKVGTRFRYLQGGLGFYSAASYPNPFIHIDTRGYDARWQK